MQIYTQNPPKSFIPTIDVARKVIALQFPEYSSLSITEVERQGHDNRTYRLGSDMIIRMPTGEKYAMVVNFEHETLPKLAKYLDIEIPIPLKKGAPSADYPYPFSIYKWLPGESINLLNLSSVEKEQLAHELAKFLKQMHAIDLPGPSVGWHNFHRGAQHAIDLPGPSVGWHNFHRGAQHAIDLPGPSVGWHNFHRGAHVSVYDEGARKQIADLAEIIDSNAAIKLWEKACMTKWNNRAVWIHGDFAVGNMLMREGKLSAIIDFGCAAVGDPACDLVIAWTYLSGKSREIFIAEMSSNSSFSGLSSASTCEIDPDTWLRARAWALWKATFELCQIDDKNSPEGLLQKRIIDELINLD